MPRDVGLLLVYAHLPSGSLNDRLDAQGRRREHELQRVVDDANDSRGES